jgi:carbon monoxide dehydrogenase subunit G
MTDQELHVQIERHIDIAAPADRVWEVLGRGFTDVGAWASAIPSSEASPDGDGRVCSVAGAPGIDRVEERLIAYDDAARTLTYVAASGMPGAVGAASNTWRVEPLGPDHSRVSTSAVVDVVGPARFATPLLRLAFEVLGRRTLRDLEHYVECGVPSPRKERALAVDGGDGGASLATAMGWNVVFSAVSGLALLVGGAGLDGVFGVEAWLLSGLGGGLLLFAGAMLWLLAEPGRIAAGGRAVVAADVAWVAGAVGLLVGFPAALSGPGKVALGVVTVVVADLAVAQAIGLRRVGAERVTGSTPFAVRVERDLASPTDEVWRAVSDAGDFARFAPGIGATEIVSGAGQGMVRVCTDDRGGMWAESCTLWDEGNRPRRGAGSRSRSMAR